MRPRREKNNMRKLIAFNQVSLDGYFSDADGDMSCTGCDSSLGDTDANRSKSQGFCKSRSGRGNCE
jgi:hypothetical protein